MAQVIISDSLVYFTREAGVNWSHSIWEVSPLETPAGDVTDLLRAWGAGDRSAEERLFEVVLPDLHRLAQHLLKGEAPGHSVEPTSLLNEAYLRLVAARERDWQDRRHFFAFAARIMRRLLIDHARGRKRWRNVPLEGMENLMRDRAASFEQAVAINSLLDDLDTLHPDLCEVVEMRFFLGLTDEETSDALGVPLRTVQRRFGDARRWLYEKLESRPCQTKSNATNL